MDAVLRFETDVLREVTGAGVLSAGLRIVVGVSGGPDSMALLTVLRALGERHGLALDLHVAHFDHGLREEDSRRDAHFVESVTRRWGLPFHEGRTDSLNSSGGNLEERARNLRAAFLSRIARETSADVIALGHTLDDQAETVLQRLARGGGVRSLAGMEAARADGVVRPILRRRRAECRLYLEEMGIGFVDDVTNQDRRFTRNRLRLDLLPLLSESLGVDFSERLAHLADELRVEADLADKEVSRVLGAATDVLPTRTLTSAGEGAGRIVHAWLAGRGLRPARRQVEAVVRIARGENPSASLDLAGARVRRAYGELVFERAAAEAPSVCGESVAWPAPGEVRLASGWRLRAVTEAGAEGAPGAGEAIVDAGRLGAALQVRTMRPGDRIRLPAGRRKLSDLFTDRKIPRPERARLAVVTSGTDIVWVPGIAVAFDLLPGDRTKTRLRLLAEPFDCRESGTMLKNQPFRVRFG